MTIRCEDGSTQLASEGQACAIAEGQACVNSERSEAGGLESEVCVKRADAPHHLRNSTKYLLGIRTDIRKLGEHLGQVNAAHHRLIIGANGASRCCGSTFML
jgi:hypothetical protein